MSVKYLPNVYPMGDEIILIYQALGRIVPPGQLPITVGVIVFNSETLYNVCHAVRDSVPVTQKWITVGGKVPQPFVALVPVGTTVRELMQKYGFDEARPVLERASARETAARVALGAVAASFLKSLGVELVSHTVSIAGVGSPEDAAVPGPGDVAALDADPLRCFTSEVSAAMVAEVDAAHKDGETLGGVVEVLAYGLPPGLGSYTHWDRRLDARIAGALMGIQAIKGVEIGDGFLTAARRGSAAHDEILQDSQGRAVRSGNRAGGIEGGMSIGEVLRVRAAMKPIATVPHALQTVDISTGEPARAHHQRSDVCAVPAAGVVAEAMVALVLAEAVTEKFGGDSVAETARNLRSYLQSIPGALESAGTSDRTD